MDTVDKKRPKRVKIKGQNSCFHSVAHQKGDKKSENNIKGLKLNFISLDIIKHGQK